MKKEYMTFETFPPVEGRKTTRTFVRSKQNPDILLGIIKWHGAWRQYCFFPEAGRLFSIGCLKDIINFIQSL